MASGPGPYVAHTADDVQRMLDVIGLEDVDALFDSIPPELRLDGPLDLDPARTEPETLAELRRLAARNVAPPANRVFAGGGAYAHVIPSAARYLIGRGEFLTAYTPYQPEVSQGTLAAIFEFQTMIASLLGCDLANASMYDGASAAAEGVLMALRVLRNKAAAVLLSDGVLPATRAVTRTYLGAQDVPIQSLPLRADRTTDLDALTDAATAAGGPVVALIGCPNAYGALEDLGAAADIVHGVGGLLVATFAEPVAFGLVRPPGALGADIVAGEGQPLGVPLSFGGPYLGLFATSERFVRKMPGRLAGQTTDRRGKRCFTLTLSTREQHIRREKATSNICTNQGLCALMATIWLTLQGPDGLRNVAERSHRHAVWLADALSEIDGVDVESSAPFFNEIIVRVRGTSSADVVQRGLERDLLAGVTFDQIGLDDPEGERLLIAVTEAAEPEDLDALVAHYADCSEGAAT